MTINNCSISSHNEGAIRLSLGNNKESVVYITNSVIKNNHASPYNLPVSGMLIKGATESEGNPVTVVRNITFESNNFVASSSVDTVVTVMLFFVHRFSLSDCYFNNNTGTALYLENTTINVFGNLTFANNTAHSGAAIYVNGPSVIHANENTSIVFKDNRAIHVGGAVYINSGRVDQILFSLYDGLPIASPWLMVAISVKRITPVYYVLRITLPMMEVMLYMEEI